MTSLTDLREVVDVVIGVDTHVATHSAAAIDAGTGGIPASLEAMAEGYAQLVQFAGGHALLCAWAIEGTGGHGAGAARHLADLDDRGRAGPTQASDVPQRREVLPPRRDPRST